MLESQLSIVDQNLHDKHQKQADDLTQIIRSQASTVQILQQKLDKWREAKTTQNSKLVLLQEQVHALEATVKMNRLEFEKLTAKNERMQSMHKYTVETNDAKNTKNSQQAGKIGMLKMQLTAARIRLKNMEGHAGIDQAELLKKAQSFEVGYAKQAEAFNTEMKAHQLKTEHEYNALADFLSRERELRFHNEASQSAQIGQLQIQAEDLHKHNHDLEVDGEAMRKRIIELEHQLRYGKIQRKFKLSLSKVREKKKEQEQASDTIEPPPPPPPPPPVPISVVEEVIVPPTAVESDSNTNVNADGTGPATNSDDDWSSWDNADAERRANQRKEKHEKVSMKVQSVVGSSELYVRSLKYYRPATTAPSIQSIQQLLTKHIIENASAREAKYIFGWQYFVVQYQKLIYFQTLSTEDGTKNNERVLSALMYAKMNAKMAQKQWLIRRFQTQKDFWSSVQNAMVCLVNEVNNLPAMSRSLSRSLLKKNRKRKLLKAALKQHRNTCVGLDAVVVEKYVDPMAHFDARPSTSAGSRTTSFAVPRRPSTARLSRRASRKRGVKSRR